MYITEKMAHFRWKQIKFAFSQSIITVSFLSVYLFSLFPGMVVAKIQHMKPKTENTLEIILSKLYCREVNE